MMKAKLKKVMIVFGTACMLSVLAAGCGSGSKSDAKTEETQEAVKELNDTPSENTGGDMEESQENVTGKWQVLEPDVAAAFDADFIGQVRKIAEDSFFIVESKVKILEDGSLTSSHPSSKADIPESELIQVVFDDDTYFYVRNIYDNGERYEDVEAEFQDLTEHMTVDMKGRFEDNVFYATEIRMSKIS